MTDWEVRARWAEDEVATLQCEIDDLRAQLRERNEQPTWEYFAGLAFAYHDAPGVSAETVRAWRQLADAIGHYRATGGPEPRDPDEITPGRTTMNEEDRDEYGPGFVPSLAQVAHADQRIAAIRNSVDSLIDKVRRGELDPTHQPVVALSLLVADEVDALAGSSDDVLSPALAMVSVAVLRLAATPRNEGAQT